VVHPRWIDEESTEMEIVSGPWNETQVERWLVGARIPVRLGVTAPTGPLVISLWYRYDGGALWCATSATADIVKHLRRGSRVGFEVGPDVPPYRGVRGTAAASVVPDQGRATLDRLLDRYLDDANAGLAEWLRDRADDEVAVRLDDLRVSSWDFSARMAAQEPGPVLPEVG
jgi:nitroimidazol reductase NimA-like FMN-containing flavoprotein (pyridoxamine 5'-phosphate oxidase superfamily)